MNTENLGQVPSLQHLNVEHQQPAPIIIFSKYSGAQHYFLLLFCFPLHPQKQNGGGGQIMNYAITFALLIYINIFYFGLFAVVEFALLVFKCYNLSGPKYPLGTIINELFILAFLVVVESIRLLLGNKQEPQDFDSQMSAIFRILVLTVPSMYSVAYFTFWQTFVTRLDAALGMIMLLIQVMQFFSALLSWWPKVPSIKQTLKRPTSPSPYSRL